jgi:flagella basal body P-ring formation protein FlgA
MPTIHHAIGRAMLACATLVAFPTLTPAQYLQSTQRFVPDASRTVNAALEMRSEATIYGDEVKLRQIARWSDTDAGAMAGLGDLTIARLDAADDATFKTITVDAVKQTLRDAGLNQAMLRFTGATACRVSRADKTFDEAEALDTWLTGKPTTKRQSHKELDPLPVAGTPVAVAKAPTIDSILPGGSPANESQPAPRSLKALLVADLATRIGLDSKDLQLAFSPTDERLLTLAEPQFKFDIQARRARALGSVAWDVTIIAISSAGQHKASISGTARAWQDQVVVEKPIAMKGIIRAEDISSRRVLIEQLPGDTLLKATQIIGQQASRNLPAGTLVTSRAVEAVPLVRAGQLVTVTLGQGGIQVKTVARAAETGTFGQTIKVKNETTKDIYDITITGPQTGVVGESVAMAE